MKRTTSGDLARPDSRAAFSWVELVAVISALAVLTLLVLPVLAKGTESSDRLICAVNMRQLLSAVAIYVADNNGYLPHPSWGSDLTGPNNWCYATHLTSGRVAVSAANRSGPNAYTNQLPFYAAGQLARYLDSQRVLICPTDWRESMGSKGF